MIKVTEADIGRLVVYRTPFKVEEGIITSFNEKYVFVRYGKHSAATDPKDLEWCYSTN